MSEILDYFWAPWKSGYDIPKTLAYSIVFVLAAYLIYLFFKRMKIKIDSKLALGLSPYIFFGATLRVLQDSGLINSYWFVTPGIYFFVASIAISVLLISILLQRKKGIPYHKILFVIGILLVSFSFPFLEFRNIDSLFYIILFFLPFPLILILLKRWSLENITVSSIQVFDAVVTYVSITFFGYSEQHVLPTFLINLFTPLSFVFLKVVAVISFLLLIDKFSDDKELNSYLKLIVGILGAATGSRDFLRLLCYV